MNNDFFYELRNSAIDLKEEKEHLLQLKMKEDKIYTKCKNLSWFELNKMFLNNSKLRLFLSGAISIGIIALLVYEIYIASTIGLILLTTGSGTILGINVFSELKNIKKNKLIIDKTPEFKNLTKEERDEIRKELSEQYKKTISEIQISEELINKREQELQERITTGSVLLEPNIRKENPDYLLEEFLQEPINYRNIHLDDSKEVEYNKKLTKIYNK